MHKETVQNRSPAVVGRPPNGPQTKEEDDSKKIERCQDELAYIGRAGVKPSNLLRLAWAHYGAEAGQNCCRREQ